MQETPQQYMQRILGYTDGKEPLRVQRTTAKKLAALTKRLNKKQLAHRPAPGKWSITEILAHLADTELVAGWRLRLMLSEPARSKGLAGDIPGLAPEQSGAVDVDPK